MKVTETRREEPVKNSGDRDEEEGVIDMPMIEDDSD
jgi:hypothetical protein